MSQISKILTAALRRKKAIKPKYSQRALARDLGISPAFVSGILSGRKGVPKERLDDLCHLLELDVRERSTLEKEVFLGRYRANVLPPLMPIQEKVVRRNTEGANRAFLEKWFNIAILEGLSLSQPLNDLNSLRSRLGLTHAELESAIKCLESEGLIEIREDRLQKKEAHVYLPTGRSRKEIRHFHEQMLAKARTHLLTKSSDEDFHRRLVSFRREIGALRRAYFAPETILRSAATKDLGQIEIVHRSN